MMEGVSNFKTRKERIESLEDCFKESVCFYANSAVKKNEIYFQFLDLNNFEKDKEILLQFIQEFRLSDKKILSLIFDLDEKQRNFEELVTSLFVYLAVSIPDFVSNYFLFAMAPVYEKGHPRYAPELVLLITSMFDLGEAPNKAYNLIAKRVAAKIVALGSPLDEKVSATHLTTKKGAGEDMRLRVTDYFLSENCNLICDEVRKEVNFVISQYSTGIWCSEQ